MKVCVVEQNGRGGLIHYAYQMCTALSDLGIEVILLTARDYELSDFPHNFRVEACFNLWPLFDPKAYDPRQQSSYQKIINKIRWNTRRIWRGTKLLIQWFRVTRILLDLQPDIVQFGKMNFVFESMFLAILKKRGLTLTQICHEFEHRERKGKLQRMIDTWNIKIFQQFSAIFFHSEENRARFHTYYSFPQEKSYLIPHGNENIFLKAAEQDETSINFREKYAIPAKVPVVVFFGIVSPSKGVVDLLDAFSVVSNVADCRLVIAGYPSKHMNIDEVRKKIDELTLQEKVILDLRYLGFNEIPALMRIARVVVFPYHSSTQSGALQVAYSFGRPVIATHVGGLPEAVLDGKSGYLVPPHCPVKLAEKILIFIENREIAEKMGAEGKHLCDTRFSWMRISEKIHDVYSRLLADQ